MRRCGEVMMEISGRRRRRWCCYVASAADWCCGSPSKSGNWLLNGLVNDRQVSTSLPSEIETIEAGNTNKRGSWEEDRPSIHPFNPLLMIRMSCLFFHRPRIDSICRGAIHGTRSAADFFEKVFVANSQRKMIIKKQRAHNITFNCRPDKCVFPVGAHQITLVSSRLMMMIVLGPTNFSPRGPSTSFFHHIPRRLLLEILERSIQTKLADDPEEQLWKCDILSYQSSIPRSLHCHYPPESHSSQNRPKLPWINAFIYSHDHVAYHSLASKASLWNLHFRFVNRDRVSAWGICIPDSRVKRKPQQSTRFVGSHGARWLHSPSVRGKSVKRQRVSKIRTEDQLGNPRIKVKYLAQGPSRKKRQTEGEREGSSSPIHVTRSLHSIPPSGTDENRLQARYEIPDEFVDCFRSHSLYAGEGKTHRR